MAMIMIRVPSGVGMGACEDRHANKTAKLVTRVVIVALRSVVSNRVE
jgi:hypothetical protein